MERLTEKDWKDKCAGYPWNVHPVKDIDDLPYYKKLAAYEDAEEQGLLLRLPAPLDGVERFSLDNGKTTWQRVYEADMPEEGTAMNENEAIEVLKDFDKQVTAKADGAYQSTVGKMACDTAIKALEEVQQYRAIGTVEECRTAIEKQVAMKKHCDEEGCLNCPYHNPLLQEDKCMNDFVADGSNEA